ncbi:MAG: hypothetical protein JO001_20495 [Alphaproteobacteria bacterium]|nr:hypothetical protein [Alphaproteobacteria bacterium]
MTDIEEAGERLTRLAELISPLFGVSVGGQQQQVGETRSSMPRPLTALDYVGRLSAGERTELVRLINVMLNE